MVKQWQLTKGTNKNTRKIEDKPMTKILFALYISAIFLASCSATNRQFGQVIIEDTGDPQETKQEILKIKELDNNIFDSSTFLGTNLEEVKYRLFNPTQQKTNKTYPLIVVYHGSADVGTDNNSQLKLFQKLFATPDIQEDYPAYVLAPQFSTRSSDYLMDTTRNLLYSSPRSCLNSVFELIDSLKLNLNIDKNRIYVVGYSMGGSTVINSLSERPDLFAAGISIAGIPQFDNTEGLSEIPVWLIHGTNDTVNPIESDEQLYNEISNNIRFWKLKSKGHDNIVITDILGEALPRWLFKHIKK